MVGWWYDADLKLNFDSLKGNVMKWLTSVAWYDRSSETFPLIDPLERVKEQIPLSL